jgi:hypothetical protein
MSAATLRRITVTHTASHVYDPRLVALAWFNGPKIPDYLLRGDEDTNEESRAMTMYEAYGESLVELFHPLQDDDTGYEVGDYDPEA